jgi:hypothetical protein
VRPAVALLALSLTGCAAVIDWINTEQNPPTPSKCQQTGCPAPLVCTEAGACVAPSPRPSPVEPSPEPEPTPKPSPSAVPPSPEPSPSPCVSKPLCVTRDGLPAVSCVSCAEWIAGALRSGDLTVVTGDILTNGRDFINRKDCWVVYQDGTRKADRYRNDGTVCREGCSKAPEPCASPSPSPTPAPSSDRYCSLEPGATNWPLMAGSDKLPSEGGKCPACWGDNPDKIIARCGVKHKATQSRNGGDGRRYIFDVTCHSDAPRCPHRPDQRSCDVLWACQPPEPAMYQTFAEHWHLARVDRVSHNPYLGQIHISDPAENGWYVIHACPPGVSPDGPDGDSRCGSLSIYVGTDGELK